MPENILLLLQRGGMHQLHQGFHKTGIQTENFALTNSIVQNLTPTIHLQQRKAFFHLYKRYFA